jgi:hypothetical protein
MTDTPSKTFPRPRIRPSSALPSSYLSTAGASALYIGALLGPSLLLLPGLAARAAGPASLLAWLALLALSGLIAVVFCALGTRLGSAGGVAGYTVIDLLDEIRLMNVNSVFSDTESAMPFVGWLIWVALIGSAATIAIYTKFHRVWFGADATRRFPTASLLWRIGLIAGLWWTALTQLTPPDQVGVAVDPTFGHDQAWGVGEWIWYATKWWIPALVSLVLLLPVLGRVRGGRRRARIARVQAIGRQVPGAVTRVIDKGTVNDQPLVKWTFRFADSAGQDRWVERTDVFPVGEKPRVGTSVRVLFDPTRPGDRKRIFVSFGTGDTSSEFLRKGVV